MVLPSLSPGQLALQIPCKRVCPLGPDFRQRRDFAWKKRSSSHLVVKKVFIQGQAQGARA